MKNLAAVASLVLALGCGGRGAAAPGSGDSSKAAAGYRVHLSRDAKVGRTTRVRVVERSSKSSVALVDGKVAKEERADERFKLTGLSTVHEVDDDGNATHVEYEIGELRVGDARGERVLVSGGRVVEVHRGPQKKDTRIKARDGSLDQAAVEVLDELVGQPIGRTNDDEVFGTDQPQTVGGRWPVLPERILASAKKDRLPFGLADPQGEMGLVSLEEVQGHECMVIDGGFRARVVSMQGLPEGLKVADGGLLAKFHGAFPIDPTLPKLESRVEMHFVLVTRGSVDDKQVETRVEMVNVKNATVELVR